jgi:hypothetical protein
MGAGAGGARVGWESVMLSPCRPSQSWSAEKTSIMAKSASAMAAA